MIWFIAIILVSIILQLMFSTFIIAVVCSRAPKGKSDVQHRYGYRPQAAPAHR